MNSDFAQAQPARLKHLSAAAIEHPEKAMKFRSNRSFGQAEQRNTFDLSNAAVN